MASLLITILIILVQFHIILGFLFSSKIASPNSDVHINVENHVAGALQNHSLQFQHTWRDYSIILLLVVVIGSCCVGCCCAVVVFIYRRLLFQLVRHSSRPITEHTASHNPVYMLT